jgi:hypothetical protein
MANESKWMWKEAVMTRFEQGPPPRSLTLLIPWQGSVVMKNYLNERALGL